MSKVVKLPKKIIQFFVILIAFWIFKESKRIQKQNLWDKNKNDNWKTIKNETDSKFKKNSETWIGFEQNRWNCLIKNYLKFSWKNSSHNFGLWQKKMKNSIIVNWESVWREIVKKPKKSKAMEKFFPPKWKQLFCSSLNWKSIKKSFWVEEKKYDIDVTITK